jgi:hypothetical protein
VLPGVSPEKHPDAEKSITRKIPERVSNREILILIKHSFVKGLTTAFVYIYEN